MLFAMIFFGLNDPSLTAQPITDSRAYLGLQYLWIYFMGLVAVSSGKICKSENRRFFVQTDFFHKKYTREFEDALTEIVGLLC